MLIELLGPGRTITVLHNFTCAPWPSQGVAAEIAAEGGGRPEAAGQGRAPATSRDEATRCQPSRRGVAEPGGEPLERVSWTVHGTEPDDLGRYPQVACSGADQWTATLPAGRYRIEASVMEEG